MRCRRCNTAQHVHHSVYFDGWFCTRCLDWLYDTEEAYMSHNGRAAAAPNLPHSDGTRAE